MSADLQQVVVHVHMVEVVLSVAQSLVDEQVHGGRTSDTHTHTLQYYKQVKYNSTHAQLDAISRSFQGKITSQHNLAFLGHKTDFKRTN